MIKVLYLFANIGFLHELPKSGGQTSARRVMAGLKENGFSVIPIRRHRAEMEGKWKHLLEITVFAVIDLLKIVLKLLLKKRKNAAFLHLTYAGPLVPYELLITLVVRFMGYKSITYLKGGQVLDYYAQGSIFHKWMFKKNMDLQAKVFFEGMESLELVRKISQSPLAYFPNYVSDDLIPISFPEKPVDNLNICYFGRISPGKNIHIIIGAFEELCKKYNNVHLTIIGGPARCKQYVEKIDQMISESNYVDRITRVGLSSYSFIAEILKSQHIFLFPSMERCEGHSNSLNEAMSYGLVPIVSRYHFNSSIVGCEECVVDDFEIHHYAERIETLWNNGLIEQLGMKMWKRIKQNYSYSVVNLKLQNEFEKL